MLAGRKVWLLIDGLPYWLIERWSQGTATLPLLTALLRSGRLARLGPAEPNCQTPPSLATLYSGTPAARLGITGYDVPVFSRLDEPETVNAFKKDVLGRPPWIWVHESLAALPVRMSHIPFVSSQDLGERLEVASYGFVEPLFAPDVVPLTHTGFQVLATFPRGDLSAKAHRDGARVRVNSASGSEEYNVTTGAFRVIPLPGTTVETAVMLTDVETGPTMIVLGAWLPEYSGSARGVATHRAAMRGQPFFAASLTRFYRGGRLGRTLMDGGEGGAERLFAGALNLMARRYYEEAIALIAAGSTGLIMSYQPCIDLALHELIGYIDTECAHYTGSRSDIASRLITGMLSALDGFLGRVCAATAANDCVLVSSDHGMASMDTVVYPNVVLERRNLLVRRGSGAIDTQASACYYHPAENGVLVFNTQRLATQGTAVAAVLRSLAEDLQAETGRPVRISEWPGGPEVPAPFIARHYLWPGERCQAKAELPLRPRAPSRKTGDHCVAGPSSQLCGVVADLTGTLCPNGARSDWFKGGLIPAEAVSSLLLQ